jgi:hypothetical protein
VRGCEEKNEGDWERKTEVWKRGERHGGGRMQRKQGFLRGHFRSLPVWRRGCDGGRVLLSQRHCPFEVRAGEGEEDTATLAENKRKKFGG